MLCAVASRTPTSRSTSALAESQSLPWLYPYREDPQSTRLGEPVFRPFVYVSLVYGEHRFTVTASRFAQAIAVEEHTTFDERFGTVFSE